MDETLYNQARWIMDRLSENDFQVLCLFYLIDSGYNAELGPMPGRDYKHDIFGHGPKGYFIAHCTTQKQGLPNKLRKDILGGVQNCTTGSSPKQEILALYRSKVFSTPAVEESFKEQLLSNIVQMEPRYREPPILRIISGDQMTREICAFWGQWKASEFLLNHGMGSTTMFEDEQSLLSNCKVIT